MAITPAPPPNSSNPLRFLESYSSMNTDPSEIQRELFEAQMRQEECLETVERVKVLLKKADERHRSDTQERRKWHRVLENLERSLDDSKKRVDLANMEIARLKRSLADALQSDGETLLTLDDTNATTTSARSFPPAPSMNLEDASRIQQQLTAGKIKDANLEASLELANQLGDETESDEKEQRPRRQVALRAAIEKVRQRQFEDLSHDEINLVLSCHALLTRRLEPTPRDQRLQRILNGVVRVLRKRLATFEAGADKRTLG